MQKIDILGYVIIIMILGICFYIYSNTPELQLKCIVVDEDGKKICVRDRTKKDQAANILKKTADNAELLVIYMYKKFPEMDSVKQLQERFNKNVIMETLPNSKYTAYSENKGERISFCLNKDKHNNEDLIDDHTLMFVCIHELSHIMTKTIGHDDQFWKNFKFLLENAEEAGIHKPRDYKEEPQEYCGMKIKDNPYYDM